jgi:hypothetical protein
VHESSDGSDGSESKYYSAFDLGDEEGDSDVIWEWTDADGNSASSGPIPVSIPKYTPFGVLAMKELEKLYRNGALYSNGGAVICVDKKPFYVWPCVGKLKITPFEITGFSSEWQTSFSNCSIRRRGQRHPVKGERRYLTTNQKQELAVLDKKLLELRGCQRRARHEEGALEGRY